MTATIMPTPLGADNVIAANTLGYDVLNYVVWNAKISFAIVINHCGCTVLLAKILR